MKVTSGLMPLLETAFIFLVVAVGWIIEQLLGTGAFVFAVLALSFFYHNLLSFVANLYVLGWDKHFPMW
ncbi:hypothetical protein [Neobacillus sp. NPDC093127]|uniref:hypothetical protein n=1 Tax=Neobacillus sp. NPDC093127 TaxID=3364296 RepID=UPI003826E51E